MSGVLDALLGDPLVEAFNPTEHPRDFRGRFRAGEHVTFSHGLLGKLPAEVTKVTDSRVHISYVPGKGESSSTSMTHAQAAAKLEHMTGPLAPRPQLARGQTANELKGGIPKASAQRSLDEVVNFGGIPTKKGHVIAALQKEGHSQAHIDRYMQGLELRQRQDQIERDRRTAAGLSNEPIKFAGPPAAQKHAASMHPVGKRVQGMDAQGRPMGPPARVNDHNPDGSTVVRYDDGTTQTYTKPEALRAYDASAPGNIGSSTYRERRMARADRLEGWASKREQRSQADVAAGRQRVEQIPLGEPIHGPADRRRRERSFSQLQRGYESQAKAEGMRSRAAEIRSQADRSIYSDDPNAPQALQARLKELEAKRDRIKRYNATAKKAAKSGGTGDLSILTPDEKKELEGHRRVGQPFIGPGDSFAPFVMRNLQGNISRTRKRLGQHKAQEAGRFGVGDLLEGFSEQHKEPAWEGRFEKGDKVRVAVKGGRSVIGRVLRPSSSKPDHVVIRPDGNAPHMEAHKDSVRLDTPQQHDQMRRREEATAARANLLPPGQTGPAVSKAEARRVGATPAGPRVREGVSVLLEAFGVAGPSETPQQSQAIGKQEVATAQKQLSAGWNSSKHPRGTGGRFSHTTGGRRATRSSSASSRTLGVGSKGALVKSIQRHIGANPDGVYGPQTRAAVERFQRQHGLQVDGVVGAQTIAALRGHANARLVKPGPIKSSTAKVLTHPLQRKSRKSRKSRSSSAKVTVMPKVGKRFAGGVVVR